jgi:hypothetical protein
VLPGASAQCARQAVAGRLVDQALRVLACRVGQQVWVAHHGWLLGPVFSGDSSFGSGYDNHIVIGCVSWPERRT